MASSKRGRKAQSDTGLTEKQGEPADLAKMIAARKPPRPAQCRNFTRRAVAQSLPQIVGAFVEKASDGSVSHFNLLSKFGGFDQRPIPAPAKRRGKSFAQRLLENMQEHEAKMIAANEARIAAERIASEPTATA